MVATQTTESRETKKTRSGQPKKSYRSKVTFHVGGALHNLARWYPTLAEVISELFQNAIDAKATKIKMRLRLGRRFLSVWDNGEGMGHDDFRERIIKGVGHTFKSREELGQFGLGFVAPIGKCEHHIVRSSSEEDPCYFEARFDIDEHDSDPDIPSEDRPELVFSPDRTNSGSGNHVWWRTNVEIHNFQKDSSMLDITLQQIVDNIQTSFSHKMQKQKTEIEIELTDLDGTVHKTIVKGGTFFGQKLPEKKYDTADAGKVTISMYLAKKSKKKKAINIRFGEAENDYRFSFQNFAKSAAYELLSKEVREALISGIFEGEMVAEKVSLSVRRRSFEQNDAMIDFCSCIETWFQDQGKDYVQDEKKRQRDARYQEIGLKVIDRMNDFFETDMGKKLSEGFQKFRKGSAGAGHAPTRGKQVQPKKSLTKKVDPPEGGDKKPKTDDPKPEPKKTLDIKHLSSTGPKGQKRKVVTRGSYGLQYDYESRPGSDKLWRLDQEYGCLVFNIMHPDWVALDDVGISDYRLQALMELVTIEALTILTSDPSVQVYLRQYSDDVVACQVQWLKMGGSNPRIRRKKKSKK
jgi:hypothetical protein